nr:Uncharacterised protein [Raoultella sp. NCTC 9187]
MTKHAVAQAVGVQQRAKLDDVIRQMLRRHAGIFGKGNRFSRALRVTQQPYRLFTHRIDTLNAVQLAAYLPADDAGFALRDQPIQTLTQRSHLAVDQLDVIAGKLDDVQPQHLFIRHVGDQFADGVQTISSRARLSTSSRRFPRQRVGRHHKRRIAQRRVKRIILNVHQTTYLRQSGDVETRFGNKRQRPFRTG